MIVADANLLAYLVIPGDRTAETQDVFLKDPSWVSPTLWRTELRSVLQKSVLHQDLSVARAVGLFDQALTVLGGREFDVDTRHVLELAERAQASTYDCEYVAVALALNIPLVSADRAVITAFPECAVSPRQFLDRE
jgi:predicted nucleic acid-binding protein